MDRRLLISCLAALVLMPAPSWATLPEKFDPARDAHADVQEAVATARTQHKMVFVDVGGEWCIWCHVFDQFIASRPAVQTMLRERYVLVKVNYSPQNPNARLLSRWPKPKGFPHFYLLDAAGNLVVSQPSAELESGNSYDEEKLLAFLHRHLAER